MLLITAILWGLLLIGMASVMSNVQQRRKCHHISDAEMRRAGFRYDYESRRWVYDRIPK